MMMRLFNRWKKSNSEIVSQNNKPIIIKNTKNSLFNDIIGYEDVKDVFERAMETERPVHLLLVRASSLC